MAKVTFCQRQHLGRPFRLLTEASIVASASTQSEFPGGLGVGYKAGVDSRKSEVNTKVTVIVHGKNYRQEGVLIYRIYRGPIEVHEPTPKRYSTCGILGTSVVV